MQIIKPVLYLHSDGEYFIRAVSAYEMSALMEYKGLNIKEAGQELIHKKWLILVVRAV